VALAGLRAGSTVTRSELEERFLAVVREYGLPRPLVNEHVAVGGRAFEVDAVWRERRLALELDTHGFHATPESFESDRERDRVLEAAGWRVVRITWRQLTGAPGAVVADLRAILGG
jgi:very-short-patch-repair endonuclease